jgi:hypothetical protein
MLNGVITQPLQAIQSSHKNPLTTPTKSYDDTLVPKQDKDDVISEYEAQSPVLIRKTIDPTVPPGVRFRKQMNINEALLQRIRPQCDNSISQYTTIAHETIKNDYDISSTGHTLVDPKVEPGS